MFCHSDKFGHFVIYLASENQGAQFDSSNFLRGQFFFQTDPPSHQLVGRHQRRFSVIWSPLKDTVWDVPLLTQIAHPMKLCTALFALNDVLVSWLLGVVVVRGGGGSWNYVFTSCWWVSNETCFFRQSSLRPRFLCCRFLQFRQDLDAASFTSFQRACPATSFTSFHHGQCQATCSNVSLTTKCSHPTGSLCSAGPLCRLWSRWLKMLQNGERGRD